MYIAFSIIYFSKYSSFTISKYGLNQQISKSVEHIYLIRFLLGSDPINSNQMKHILFIIWVRVSSFDLM